MPKALLVLHVNLWQEWVALRLERIHHFPEQTVSQKWGGTIDKNDELLTTAKNILIIQTHLSNMAFPCLLLILILPLQRSNADWWRIFQNGFHFLFNGDDFIIQISMRRSVSLKSDIFLYKICDVFATAYYLFFTIVSIFWSLVQEQLRRDRQ